jgi:hypothetical protein
LLPAKTCPSGPIPRSKGQRGVHPEAEGQTAPRVGTLQSALRSGRFPLRRGQSHWRRGLLLRHQERQSNTETRSGDPRARGKTPGSRQERRGTPGPQTSSGPERP